MNGDLRIPDVVGEVSGWRAWHIIGTLAVPRLQSVTHRGTTWPTDQWFYARCSRGHTTEIPVESCRCGLYAARDRDHLIKLRYGAYGGREINAVGEVAFAGKVIEGSQGWRAQKGRIKSLLVPYEYWEWAEPLSAAYNVPVSVGFLFADSVRDQVIDREVKQEARDAILERERQRLDHLANRREEDY